MAVAIWIGWFGCGSWVYVGRGCQCFPSFLSFFPPTAIFSRMFKFGSLSFLFFFLDMAIHGEPAHLDEGEGRRRSGRRRGVLYPCRGHLVVYFLDSLEYITMDWEFPEFPLLAYPWMILAHSGIALRCPSTTYYLARTLYPFL